MSRTRFIRDTYRKREHVKRGIVCPFCGRRNLSENKRGSLTPRNARQAKGRYICAGQRKDERVYLAVCRLVVHRVKRRVHIAR